MNAAVVVAPPGNISYMRSEIISLVKIVKFAKKNVNLLAGQPDQQESLRSFPKMPSIQAFRRMDEAFIPRLYRQCEPVIVYFRSFFKKLLHYRDLPLWMRKWCEVEPPHSFEFANDYVSVEDMRAKLIEYNTSIAFFPKNHAELPKRGAAEAGESG